MPNSQPTPGVTYAKLVAVPAIWGGTFIAGRILALAVPAAVGALLRYVGAVVALLAYLVFSPLFARTFETEAKKRGEGMAAILEKHPNVVYIVVRATHPQLNQQIDRTRS